MEIIKIDNSNIELLSQFLSNNLSSHFRYYKKRNVDAINNHLLTIIGLEDNIPIAYGHIDYEDDKHWLGVCILGHRQNRGYGRQIIEHLLNSCIAKKLRELYLTVDVDNYVAKNMYEKFGFKIISRNVNLDTITMMKMFTNHLELPVSFGEAFDKLSILDIKLKMIQDNRKEEVKHEYNLLYERLKQYENDTIKYHYNILYLINKTIWDDQDIFRYSNSTEEKNNLCMKIIRDNDRRFRAKSKLNRLLSSDIKEQKGYNPIKLNLVTHLGLGDSITAIGMIRYLSTLCEELTYFCNKRNYENIKLFLSDETSIKYYVVEDDEEIKFKFDNEPTKSEFNAGKTTLLVGVFKVDSFSTNIIPFNFYRDIEMPYNAFWEYFHIPTTRESNELYNLIKNFQYVFIHNTYSQGKVYDSDLITKHSGFNKDEILFVNVNNNEYQEGHKFYDIAQQFVGKRLAHYKTTIINANRVYVTNSSIFCMAMNLEIKTPECYIVTDWDLNYIYDNPEYCFDPTKRRRFVRIPIPSV